MILQLRKLVHVSGAAFAFMALFDPYLAVACIAAGIIAFFGLEASRQRIKLPLLPSLYRDSELAGRAYEPLLYLLSIALLLMLSLVFMPSACYAAIIVLTIGDGVAGIVGRAFGKRKLPHSDKTWLGSLSGLAMAAMLGFIFIGPLAIAGAVAGMAVEGYSHRLENFSVAASAFLVMAILSLLL